uniref:Uncharacterized protein n=1 Tax=Timema cristinae TaxID=61476 RepID=A0A7R9CXZ5_TIMCR|nr:unnamed protein product [Timema cristinae]
MKGPPERHGPHNCCVLGDVVSWLTMIERSGCLPTQMNDFQGTRAQLRWLNLFVIPESYQAMCHVVNECRKVTAMSLFNFSFGKNINLDEFLSVQTQATNAKKITVPGKQFGLKMIRVTEVRLGQVPLQWYFYCLLGGDERTNMRD